MTKNERKRTMVYSNVNKGKNKKADKKSASKSNDIIDLDNEIVIGLASFPKPEGAKKINQTYDDKSGQTVKRKFFFFGRNKNKYEDEDTFIGDTRTKGQAKGKVKQQGKQNNKVTNKIVFNKESNKENECFFIIFSFINRFSNIFLFITSV